jgi:hypothetical protein
MLNLRDFLLRPFQVAAHFAGVAHAVLESLAGSRETGLCLLLQFQELTVLRVELSGTKVALATRFSNVSNLRLNLTPATHVCA